MAIGCVILGLGWPWNFLAMVWPVLAVGEIANGKPGHGMGWPDMSWAGHWLGSPWSWQAIPRGGHGLGWPWTGLGCLWSGQNTRLSSYR
jgi:hypothetical protein